MNKNFIYNFLITTSSENHILFQLGLNNQIKYTYLDEDYFPIETKTVLKNNILKYSVDIDSSDKIHLIALDNQGELKYSILENNSWIHKTLSKFDFQSKIYDKIVLFSQDNSINILYNYANLINSKLWTLRHITGNVDKMEQFNVTKYAQEKTLIPFAIDRDSTGSLHLLYKTIIKDNYHIYYTFYNSYTKKWNPISSKLTTNNTLKLFPYIFVDTKDNLHAVWVDKINNDYILKYSKLIPNNKNSWIEISIPNIYDCNNPPIIMEEEGILKIIYYNNSEISYIYSPDYGTTWIDGEKENLESNNMILVKLASNFSKARNTKILNLYCSIEDKLYPYFVSSLYSTKKVSKNIDNKQAENINSKNMSKDVNDEISKILKTQEDIINLLYKIIDSQKILEDNMNNIFEYIKLKKVSILDKIFK